MTRNTYRSSCLRRGGSEDKGNDGWKKRGGNGRDFAGEI